MKLPFIQFFPADYMRDTRALSLAAKGGWVDVLCMLHGSSTRGTMTLPAVGWARVMGAQVDQASAVIAELEVMKVCDVARESNGDVTLSSRRMLREHISKEQTRLRVERHRRNTPCNAVSNAEVTPKKTEDRRQKPEKKAATASPAAPPLVLPFPSEEFRAAWQLFEKHRRELRKPLTPAAIQASLRKLAAMGERRAMRCIEHSVANGWQGLFEPEVGSATPSGSAPLQPIREPIGWKNYINHEYPGSVYSAGGDNEAHQWSDLPRDLQQKFASEIRKAS